jgi:hypothetical protein
MVRLMLHLRCMRHSDINSSLLNSNNLNNNLKKNVTPCFFVTANEGFDIRPPYLRRPALPSFASKPNKEAKQINSYVEC